MDEYVKRQLSSVPGHIGFYYKNLVTGETDGSRQTELFQAASVIKLPILAAILLEEREQAELVRRALGELERPDRELFVRHYYYGQTVARAAEEMGHAETFHGYGPEQGYAFLRDAIAEHDFAARNIAIAPDEIFVSDGAKSDCGNIGDIFAEDNIVAVCDPVYPVYVDTNAMAGRAGDYDADTERWTNIVYMPTTAENDFTPALPDVPVDLIYLCSPNNPTGTVLSREALQRWVDFANATDAVILFDAAYERFIADAAIPHSIYEIPGAKTCAIEFRSFSKTAGFTGARCGYTVVPHDLVREGQSLNAMWNRRQTTKFNGASYVIQRGAAAIYTPEGAAQVDETIDFYRTNARTIKEGLAAAGLEVYGADNSPYVWCRTPNGASSWDFFNRLLEEANVITTPGAGFGPAGEGYIRLTAFGDAEDTKEAVERIKRMLDAESRD